MSRKTNGGEFLAGHNGREMLSIEMRIMILLSLFMLFLASCSVMEGPSPETLLIHPLNVENASETMNEKAITLILYPDGTFHISKNPELCPEGAVAVNFQCEKLSKLLSDESPLSPLIKQRLAELDGKLLVLNANDLRAFCKNHNVLYGCFDEKHDVLALPPFDNAVESLASLELIAEFISSDHDFSERQMGDFTIQREVDTTTINGNDYNGATDRVMNDLVAVIINRWLFGQPHDSRGPGSDSALMSEIGIRLMGFGDAHSEFGEFEQEYYRGLARLIGASPDQGFGFVNAWLSGDVETALTLLAKALKEGGREEVSIDATTGAIIFEGFSSHVQGYLEAKPEPQSLFPSPTP